MVMAVDLYERLGLDRLAKPDEIKHAYRRLARQMHPDNGGDPDDFIDITEAYNVLMDPEARKDYDLAGYVDPRHHLKLQRAMIDRMAALLDTTFQEAASVPIEMVDVVETMKNVLRVEVAKDEARREELYRYLTLLQKVRGGVKREGEGQNAFIAVVDSRVPVAQEELTDLLWRLKVSERAKEELDCHKSIVEVVRFVQAGMYPAQGGSGVFSLGSIFRA